uniref:receptor protein-tyrosine kinase n=1 Tax=Haemonchus contortus TaxID=6289 RepID=A0A068F0Z0_HAECO|nr:insulin-like receptor [Haemonchus contortus]
MLILISIIVLCLCMQISDALPERRCGTLDIRNHPNQGYKLAGHKSISSNHVNCSVLEGSMVLSLIQNSNVTEADFPMFRHLREITGSLLIFHVRKLSTLSRIFPNLRIIGGQNLIQHFSLIIYQNEDLIDIGLTKLRLIRNGGVRVAENNKMCYSRYIDWKHLMAGPLNDILVDDSVEIGVGEGKILSCTDDCDVEDESKCRRVVHSRGEQLSCWNKHTCQEDCPYDRINGSVGPGCADSNGAKCHAQCVAGCTVPDDDTACYGCLHYNHNGACVEKCPRNLFVYLNRRCITEAECDSMPALRGGKDVHKPANGVCATICPEGMEEDPSNKKRCRKCAGECVRKCPGNITVDSMSKAMQLKHCSVIEGYLEVEMRVGMSAVAASQLTGIFGKITTIDGYFVVRLSPSFVNLHMFRSLTRITGRSLYRDKYAMSIFENSNLQKLFPPENRLVIDTGSVQFQNNRMLCYFRIKELMVKLGREQEMSEEDQSLSYYSNGDKAICEESSFNLTVVESAVSQTAFTLRWPALNTSDIDHRKFLGYDILYKEVAWADPNLSIDDDRSSCQDTDSWYYHFEGVNDNIERINGTGPEYVTAMIANSHIKPHTLYAAYVTTKMVRHQGARNAVSNIAFVRTRFAVPDPPRITKAEALGTDEILVEWDPPTQPNGDISHYVVSWRAMNDAYMNQHMGAAVCHDDLTRSLDLSLGLPDGLREPTTPAPRAVSVLLPDKGEPQSDTCPRNEGCCKCAPKAVSTELDEGVESQTAFENAVHNVVFVQNKEVARKRRAITTPAGSKDGYGSKLSTKSATTFRNSINALAEAARNDVITVNVTATSFAIKGLKHYTRYFIQVTVCQDPTAPETHCSAKRAWQYVRTKPIMDADRVDNSTINVVVLNGTSDIRITWKKPVDPNGMIVAYKVKVMNTAKQSTPVDQCIPVSADWSPNVNGAVFKGLNDGAYRVELRTVSLVGVSQPTYAEELFEIYTPGFWTLKNILLTLFFLLLFAVIVGIVGYFFVKKYYSQKVKEYATQLISANPEYLSQADVYKPDEWELQRSDLTLECEIGRGTFGKVYRGYGNNVLSRCGDTFGLCAIKTVTETANSAERLHFLLEANVMKSFSAEAFIVKLYGVVSDGQPVLVVMEMMEKGNLRDYLRSRRPGAEENVDNLPVPTIAEYYEWAAQIADGMAYLESIRFCHRDLAARNCMVHANNTVKIGDFGMARDIYYHEYYKPNGKRLMPVRWMAPESLRDGTFDMKSDVWSYGIVLYEMLTLGQQPYQGLANEEVLSFIGISRKTLDRPMDCPDFWYDLMVECWRYVPRERPTFRQIVEHLIPLASDQFREASWIYNHPATDYASDSEPIYVPDGQGMQLLATDETADEVEYRLANRAGSAKPRRGEGDSLDTDSEAEDEV